MNKNSISLYLLPTTGACITFAARLFGVPTKGAVGYSHKQFERLSDGKLSGKPRAGEMPKMEEVSRRVIDEIVRAFTGEQQPGSVMDRVLIEKDSQPQKYLEWWQGPDGNLLNLRDHLVRDLIEFIHRHEMLVQSFDSGASEPCVVYQWLGLFVLPFLVMNLVEYQRNGADIEKGVAFHRAFNEAYKFLGAEAAVRLVDWFRDLHFVLVDLHNRSNNEAEGEQAILRLLREKHSWGDDRRDAVEWLFDWAGWEKLPAELAARFMEARMRQRPVEISERDK